MEKGQIRFGGDDRFNTFEKNQIFLYATNKLNKLNDTSIIVGGDTLTKGKEVVVEIPSKYYVGVPLIKNFLISDKITLRPDGQFKISK